MLSELYIENLLLIDRLQLSFSEGLNVLSGETGAGKSMIIGALSLLMGERAAKEDIRSGEERCLLRGLFSAPFSAPVQEFLSELGMDPDAEELLLSREFSHSGKSVCRIDMQAVPLSFLRELAQRLLNINGQAEHLTLLRPEAHLRILDLFGGADCAALRESTSERWTKWRELLTKEEELRRGAQDAERRADLLHYQIDEIEKAALAPEEEETLERERNVLRHAEKLAEESGAAYQALRSGDYAALDGVSDALAALQKSLRYDEGLNGLCERLESAFFALEETARELDDYRQNVVADPGRLEEVDSRLAEIRRLKRKYGDSIEEVLSFAADCRQELDRLENSTALLSSLDAEIQAAAQLYEEKAAALSTLRLTVAAQLEAAIQRELADLKLAQARFSVQLGAAQASASGSDRVEFLFSANPGEAIAPLAKAASGGEMARVMLALKLVLARLEQVPTLIFDEIDSGVGGIALNALARKLQEVSANAQALCVTHAPLLAARADRHLHIEKEEREGRTVIRVQPLDESGRVRELCRMLSGDSVTGETEAQARAMLLEGKRS